MVRSACVLLSAVVAAARPTAVPTSLPRPAQSPTGTYTHVRSADNTFQILALPDGRIRVGFDGTNGRNFGRLFGTAPLEGNETSFAPHDTEGCRIHLRFAAEMLTVRQEGHSADCGLGNGVLAEGTFKRTSRKTPRIEGFEGENPFAGKP
jgi:hypothetical protein